MVKKSAEEALARAALSLSPERADEITATREMVLAGAEELLCDVCFEGSFWKAEDAALRVYRSMVEASRRKTEDTAPQ
jgi:hypothetical protein